MHILVLPSWFPYPSRPLAGIFFREQALALREAGYQVGVVAPILKSMKEIRVAGNFCQRGTYWEDDHGVATLREERWAIPSCHELNMSRWLAIGRRLVRDYFVTKGHPDIVHAHSMLYAGVLAAEIKKNYKIPFVITEHSSAYALGLIHDWQWPSIRTVIRESSSRIAVSQELALLLRTLVPVSGADWNYLPNMVDVQFFCPTRERSTATSNRRFVFFSAALLTKNKGTRFLIDAFAKAFSEEEVELWIAGNGEERKRLEEQAALLGVEAKIRFLGSLSREQMRATMQQCDAFVLPSLYETFGMVLIEAIATGKPVIATRSGGPASIVHERNGLLVAPADAAALGRAMRQIVESIDRFDADAVRADCIARFSRQTVIEGLGRLYGLVLGQSS